MRTMCLYVGGVLILMLSRCTPEPLPVKNIPTATSRMVVASQMLTDQSVIVTLTKTIGALDAGKESDPKDIIDQIIVDDAIVTITHNDSMDTLQYLGEGVYGNAGISIVTGQTYELHAKSQTSGEISATTVAQMFVPFERVTASLYYEQSDSLAHVEYTVNDPAGKNFYLIALQRLSRTQDSNAFINPRLYTHIFTDDGINGGSFSDKFNVLFQRFHLKDTVIVSLTNIDSDYYDYMKQRIDNRFSVTAFATEPFNYKTNVTGGYGFFNLQRPDIHVFVLQ